MIITKYFKDFFYNSKSSGIILLICLFLSLLIANSSFSSMYQSFLDKKVGWASLGLEYSVAIWVNDGLMAIFFLLVGLEIKREIVEGELSNFKNASLPIFAALGGMLVPALIYFLINHSTPQVGGWGIPMATDIAFSLAILSMLGKGIPASIKIFLAALAIVDDLGAIVVIALFYTESIEWIYLLLSLVVFLVLVGLNYFKVERHIFYIVPGILLWYLMHHSGIHATIAGVLLAFTIPTNVSVTEISPLEKLEQKLHIPVNFFIMPIFALVNVNITFQQGMVDGLFSKLGLGILLGLAVGKVLGICLFSWLSIQMKWSNLPDKATWKQMIGVGFLAGIGFTMSIFIAMLSFKNDILLQSEAKFSILVASFVSGAIGFLILKKNK